MRTDRIVRTWLAAPALAVGLSLALGGCKQSQQTQAPIEDAAGTGDPAAVNLAPETLNPGTPVNGSASAATGQPARVLGQSLQGPAPVQQGEAYPQQAGQPGQPLDQSYNGQPYNSDAYNAPQSDYNAEVDAGQQAIEAQQPPPPLPEYQQPPAPDPNYEWTPGYWAWGPGGYYWVPGVWVAAPYTGALWTPPYWGFYGGHYWFHHGYWGPHVGFYGGIPYGFGYIGLGFEGGYWRGNSFFYNRAVTNIGGIHNYYSHPVPNIAGARVSFNGGPGGWNVRPRPAEAAAFREQHAPAMQTQLAVAHEAAQNRGNFYAENHGRPAMAVRTQPVAAEAGYQQRVQNLQQRNAVEQQRNQNLQQRNANEQLRNSNEQQRNANLQQHNANEQLRDGNEQQRNANLQQHNANEQLRNGNEQQRNANLQQHNQQEQERNQNLQQRNQQEQQRNVQEQQRNQVEQQRNIQEQQRTQQEQQRNANLQQRNANLQQRNQQEQQRNQVEQRQAQPQGEQRPFQQARPPEQHAAPAPRPAAPQQHAEPHAAPAPHGGGGEHPKR